MLANILKGATSLVLELRASATSSTPTITVPSSTVKGDLLVLFDQAFGTTLPAAVNPAGFQSPAIISTTLGNRRIIVSMKIANGTEGGTSITGMDGNNAEAKILFVFSTNGATNSTAFDATFQGTDGDPAAQTIDSGGGVVPLVAIGVIRDVSGTAAKSMTPTQDGIVQQDVFYAYYKIFNSAPPGNVVIVTAEGGNNNMLMYFYIEVA